MDAVRPRQWRTEHAPRKSQETLSQETPGNSGNPRKPRKPQETQETQPQNPARHPARKPGFRAGNDIQRDPEVLVWPSSDLPPGGAGLYPLPALSGVRGPRLPSLCERVINISVSVYQYQFQYIMHQYVSVSVHQYPYQY